MSKPVYLAVVDSEVLVIRYDTWARTWRRSIADHKYTKTKYKAVTNHYRTVFNSKVIHLTRKAFMRTHKRLKARQY